MSDFYCNDNISFIAATGVHRDVEYIIVGIDGSHPTAYIRLDSEGFEKCPLTVEDYYDPRLDAIDAHGGFTFLNDYLFLVPNHPLPGRFIGWDYMHPGDAMREIDTSDFRKYKYVGHKWTIEEITVECEHVIDQLLALAWKEKYEKEKHK